MYNRLLYALDEFIVLLINLTICLPNPVSII